MIGSPDAASSRARLADDRLLDLSIDSAFELSLARQRTYASIEVALSGLAIHRSVSRYVKSHLIGRNPSCVFYEGVLYANFSVENHSQETMAKVRTFASQLMTLLGGESADVAARVLDGDPGTPIL